MQVNGVTLPDIPSDVLANYPYAVIFHFYVENTYNGYGLFATNQPILHFNGSLLGTTYPELLGSLGAGVTYDCSILNTESWTLDVELSVGNAIMPVGKFKYANTSDATYTVIWANHDIYEMTSLNLSTFAYTIGGIYLPDSENDERLSIARNMLIHYATQARRLSGTQEALKPEQMLEKYKDVIDIGELYGGTIKEASHGSVQMLKDGLFEECRSLTTVSFPAVRQVSENAFSMCIKLASVHLPVATSLFSYAFSGCSALKKLELPAVTSIGVGVFGNCTALEALILRSGTVCTLGTNAFANSAIASGTGYIYVPSALVNSYKTATNWYAHANQIRAIEDYPEICGTTA